MRAVWIFVITAAFTAAAQTPGRGRGGVPSISTRPPDSHSIPGAATSLMGWRVGIPATAFRQLTFSDAAAKVDAAGLGFIEGSSDQKVSAAIAKNLDYNLSADELAAVRHRLSELRLHMAAYTQRFRPMPPAGGSSSNSPSPSASRRSSPRPMPPRFPKSTGSPTSSA